MPLYPSTPYIPIPKPPRLFNMTWSGSKILLLIPPLPIPLASNHHLLAASFFLLFFYNFIFLLYCLYRRRLKLHIEKAKDYGLLSLDCPPHYYQEHLYKQWEHFILLKINSEAFFCRYMEEYFRDKMTEEIEISTRAYCKEQRTTCCIILFASVVYSHQTLLACFLVITVFNSVIIIWFDFEA